MSSRQRVMKPKRKRLSLKEKIDVIEKSETMSLPDLVKTFDSGFSTIYNILKHRNELTNEWIEAQNPEVKNKMRKTQHERVNEATLNWFRVAKAKNLPVSGPLLQEKARKYAEHYGDATFTASNGWLESFKKRNALVFNAICGEALDVNPALVDDWHSKIPTIIAGYDKKDIANCDETALFYRAIPQKSFAFKGEKCSGGKLAKERLSALLCAFADGKFEKP